MSLATQEPAKAALVKGDQKVGNNLRDFTTFVKQRQSSIEAVAARHMNPARVTRILIACVSRTPALRNCTMDSIMRAALQAAELGLEPGSATGEAYLVPYGDQCTLIPGYRGLISLARRSGEVSTIMAYTVYQSDKFEFELGLHPKLVHVPDPTAARDADKITYAYCVIKLKDGGELFDVMTRGEVDRIKNRSRASKSGPWVTDYAEMAKKTVTRRTLKYAPMSVEMSRAIAMDEAFETGDDSIMAEFSDALVEELVDSQADTTTKTDTLKGRLAGKGPDTEEENGYSGPVVSDDAPPKGQENLPV